MDICDNGVCSCRMQDLPGVIRLVDEAMRKKMDQSMLTDYPLVYEKENLKNISVMKKDGNPVSVVPFIPHPIAWEGVSFTLGIISPTATDPAHQRKGYGRACLRHCVENMKKTGVDVAILWTMAQTFPFYETESFVPAGHIGWQKNLCGSDERFFENRGFVVCRASKEDLPAIFNMHAKDKPTVQRTRKRTEVLFSLPKITTWIAKKEKEPMAYMTVGSGVNKPGLIEAGGEPEGIEALIKHVLREQTGDATLRACLYEHKDALSRIVFQKMGSECEPLQAGLPMMRINRVEPFFQKIQPLLEKRAQGHRFSISFESEQTVVGLRCDGKTLVIDNERSVCHEVMDRKRLSCLVFGCSNSEEHKNLEVLQSLFPLRFPIWILDRS